MEGSSLVIIKAFSLISHPIEVLHMARRRKSIDISERTDDGENSIDLDLEKDETGLGSKWLFPVAATIILIIGLLIWKPWKTSASSEGEQPHVEHPDGPNKEITYQTRVQQFVLQDDFLTAITSETESLPLSWHGIRDIEQVLLWTFGLRHLKAGDSMTILWRVPVVGGEIQDNLQEVQALKLGLKSLDTTLEAYLFQAYEQEDFFDALGRPLQGQFLSSPVKYGRISSLYNLNRLNPVFKQVKPHRGTDFAAPAGTPIMALADGKVLKIDEGEANGKYIRLQHGATYRTTYLHMQAFAQGLAEGDSVKQGDVIGEVGSTGSSTGPHVCLRFYIRDYQGDFIRLFPHLPKASPLPDSLLMEFLKYRDSLVLNMGKEAAWSP